MSKPLKTAVSTLALALLTAAFGAAWAMGADTITAKPDSEEFAAADYFGVQGETFVFSAETSNGSGHDVTSFQNGPDGKPLFTSDTIRTGTSPVEGTQYLAGGTYRFMCFVHGPAMDAQLTIDGSAGKPVARPDIELTVPSQTLDKVRSSGKLKVVVKARTASKDVSLVAKKGGKKLAQKGGLDLSKGANRTLKLSLTGSGKQALKNLEQAGVSVKGTVAFGAPDTAKRTLK